MTMFEYSDLLSTSRFTCSIDGKAYASKLPTNCILTQQTPIHPAYVRKKGRCTKLAADRDKSGLNNRILQPRGDGLFLHDADVISATGSTVPARTTSISK